MTPLVQMAFPAAELFAAYPPVFRNANKRVVYAIACDPAVPVAGTVAYARWRETAPPETVQRRMPSAIRPGVFEYPAAVPAGECHWHLNFADPRLFFAYGEPLFAQDEMQVAEHPVLACLREALCAQKLVPYTRDPITRRATPVTVAGVQRRCVVNTAPSPGHPAGLYGNAFARAAEAQIRAATRPLNPATMSNILAVAAPSYGEDEYTYEELEAILATAYTGFAAAVQESRRLAPETVRVVIHTGFWGCGAFGGNRTVMTVLQLLAADLAGVELCFWAFDAHGVSVATKAAAAYADMRAVTDEVPALLERLEQAGHRWGVGDGN